MVRLDGLPTPLWRLRGDLLLLGNLVVVPVLEPGVVDPESLRVLGLVARVAVAQDYGGSVLGQVVGRLHLTLGALERVRQKHSSIPQELRFVGSQPALQCRIHKRAF